MQIQSIFSREMAEINQSVADKFDIFRKVAAKLREMGFINNSEEIYQKLVSREELMTTGIGKGFAIPHAFTGDVSKTLVYFVSLKDGVDFSSLDNKPVRFIFVLIGPKNKEGLHLKILARISRILNNSEFSKALAKVEKPEEFIHVIKYYDEQLKIS